MQADARPAGCGRRLRCARGAAPIGRGRAPRAMPAHDADPYRALSDSLRRLAERGQVRRYPKGTMLIHEGDQGSSLFIILRGSLRVFGTGDRGREIVYGVYGPGEYVGEMSLDGGPRSASVLTAEATDCAFVARPTLERHIAEHPEFAFELLAKVIRRARAATLRTKQIGLNDVYGRLVAALDELALPQPDGSRLVAERPTHKELAARLACSREMVTRLLHDLHAGGYVVEAGERGRAWRLSAKPLPARW